jgi:hypothetical protein
MSITSDASDDALTNAVVRSSSPSPIINRIKPEMQNRRDSDKDR